MPSNEASLSCQATKHLCHTEEQSIFVILRNEASLSCQATKHLCHTEERSIFVMPSNVNAVFPQGSIFRIFTPV
ncbi:hypothetical protein [Dulcicalothrix desertica]|nr:hypothetical protein [Dulcicalothrix desertica]